MRHITLFVVVLAVTPLTNVSAQGQRGGFFAGFGVGPGLVSTSGDGSKIGVATEFQIGFHIGKSLRLHYLSRLAGLSRYRFDNGNVI